ncbi:MAG: DUF177 domain-containing protein [Clostridia bacterium]|nr:DUF177 domain-containing protein [Clostridia bacterium]
MVCDVSAIMNMEGASASFSGTLDGFSLAPDVEVISTQIDAIFTCTGGVLDLKADVKAQLVTSCARCLKEIELPLSFDFSEILVLSGQETSTDADSVIFFEGKEIDVGEIAINNLLLNISTKYLCKEDCLGLCPKCGKDLNEGDCSCDFVEIDPRWEKLKNFK